MIDAVQNDADVDGGSGETQPGGLREAIYPLIFMASGPLQYQREAPTQEAAEAMLDDLVERYTTVE